jgi:hypothetical protein
VSFAITASIRLATVNPVTSRTPGRLEAVGQGGASPGQARPVASTAMLLLQPKASNFFARGLEIML